MAQLANRSAPRQPRDSHCKKHNPAFGGKPPDGAHHRLSQVPVSSRFKLRGSKETASPAGMLQAHNVFSFQLGVESLANTKLVVIPETPRNSGSSSDGSGKEWPGPTWQWTDRAEEFFLGALYNLLGNAELMTPVVKGKRSELTGRNTRQFTPEPDYCGDGLIPPQRPALHCEIRHDNVIDFKTAMRKAKRVALTRKWHSDREAANRRGDEVSTVGPVYASLPGPAIQQEASYPPKDGAPVTLQVVGEPTTYRGDTREQDLQYLPINVGLAMHCKGYVYLSPEVYIERSGPDTVTILHRNKYGLLFERTVDEDRFYEALDDGVCNLLPEDVLSPTKLTAGAAEVVLDLPSANTHALWDCGPHVMETHWWEWLIKSRHTESPIVFTNSPKTSDGVPLARVDLVTCGEWESDPSIDCWDIPVLEDRCESKGVPSNWVEARYQMEQDQQGEDDMYSQEVEDARARHHQLVSESVTYVNFPKPITQQELDAAGYHLWNIEQMYEPRIEGLHSVWNLDTSKMKDDVLYQLWLMERRFSSYPRVDESYSIAHKSRAQQFLSSVPVMELDQPIEVIFGGKVKMFMTKAGRDIKSFFKRMLTPPPKVEPLDLSTAPVWAISELEAMDTKIMSGSEVINDAVNHQESERLSEMLEEELSPVLPPPKVDEQAAKVAISEKMKELYSSGGIYLGTVPGLERTEAGLILPRQAALSEAIGRVITDPTQLKS